MPEKFLHRYELMNYFCLIFFFIFLMFGTPASAEVQYDQHTIAVSGKIRLEEYNKLSTILANESVSTIVFKNSGGGSFFSGINIGKLIAEKKIKTVVEGICASACAIAFLGGDPREFSSNQSESALMFHPGFAGTNQVPAEETKAVFFEWVEARTRQPLSSEFVAVMDNIKKRKGGVYFLSPLHSVALRNRISVFFCEGEEKNVSHCSGQGNLSAEKMRIITP